jgi:MFS family permease
MNEKNNREIMQDINDVRGYYSIGFATFIPSVLGTILAYQFKHDAWTSMLTIIAVIAMITIIYAVIKERKIFATKTLPKNYDHKRSLKIKLNAIIGTSSMPVIFLFMIFTTAAALPFLYNFTYVDIIPRPPLLHQILYGFFSECISIALSYLIGMRFCRLAIEDASKEHYDIFGETDYYPLAFLAPPTK